MNIFSKIISSGYNNELERILENKTFNEDVKNLLLSMLYKIENGYSDYYKVKVNAISKEEFIEKILNIINEYCFEIVVVTPKTEESKLLEEKNRICDIDINKGSILVYANERDLLYSLIKIELLQKEYKYLQKNKEKEIEKNILEEKYYKNPIKKFILKAICLSESEIIRDFDGWSWNNSIKNEVDIEINLIFQLILMLKINFENKEFYSNEFEQTLKQEDTFKKYMYIMILTIISEKDLKTKEMIQSRLMELLKFLELEKDRTKFLNKIAERKKELFNEIKNIDETISENSKLRKEYDDRNSKLPNIKKIFSISYLVDILKNERKEKLNQLKQMNEFLDPKKFVEYKEKILNEKEILEIIINNLNDKDFKNKSMINMQMFFLKKFNEQINNNLNNKEYFTNTIEEFRYYNLLPISRNKKVCDIVELKSEIEKVMNNIIDNCIDKEIITNFSNSISLCYNILKNVFITNIIDLKEVKIRINKIKEEKYSNNEKMSYIKIIISDSKEAENVYNERVNNINLLNVKTNKNISLFIK